MQDFSQNSCKFKGKTNTWLRIQFDDDISEELGNSIPYPQKHEFKNGKVIYSWFLDGYFDTTQGYEFLNDIIARIQITFENSKYLEHKKDEETTLKPIKLKQFQNLKSRAIQKIYESTRYDSTKDFIFYCLKLHAEVIIKEKGIFSYDELEAFAIDNFINKAKDRSTLKAKCRNIFNWYLDRNFELTKSVYVKKDKGEVMATRVEHAKKITKNTSEKYKKKILNCVTGMFKDEYIKANGKWNVSKIAKDTGTTRPTVMKYLPKDTLL
ncbi:hypothetical protein [Malaciobacter marinus]|uniref:hypothetical protein n=1 Tax=Malaciobacter marinus TaxID=505249 RepID=UPI000C080BBD|nr:hypothetical protein [Malaciobacter marinus]